MSTIKTLAQTLGLSITTVSRALDGYSDVSAKTRARVAEHAAAIGYRPNAAARRLRRGSSELIALVLPTEPGHFNEPLYLQLLAPLGQRLAREGYDLTLIAAMPGVGELKTYQRIVEGRRADGIVVVRTRRDDERIHYLNQQGTPFVAMGRCEAGLAGHETDFAYVDGDGEAAFYAATLRLAALGHRRITHLAAPSAFTFAAFRRRGYLRAMADVGLKAEWVEGMADEMAGADLAGALLARENRPTALLCATDRMAFGALHAARRAGLSVPDDLSVTGHDNISASAFCDPPLTTMELPIEPTGTKLAEMILARIGGADPRDLQEIYPVIAIERASTARRRE